MLLHGDLHHENIMHGPRGWLAIDPKGVLGDPGFDAANMFYNPLDRDDLLVIVALGARFDRRHDVLEHQPSIVGDTVEVLDGSAQSVGS